ncbi:MAG: hypothetical protein V1491_02025 [archaeon]
MNLTFQTIGEIAVWMFIAELIIIAIFKKSGKQFKWRIEEFTPGLNSYIKKSKYILTTLLTFIIVGLIQNYTNFVDRFLVYLAGSNMLLYAIAFSFDFFFIAREMAGLSMKNNWVKIPLILFGVFVALAIVLKFI